MTPTASTGGTSQRVRFLEAVLDSAVDYAIIALDLDGAIIEWTEGAQRILGWTAAEMLGQHVSTFFDPDDVLNGVPEAEMRAARENGRASDELWHMHRDGTRFYALGEMMPLRDEGGELVGYLKILRDRTQQRLAEDALRDREAFLSSVLASSGDCIQVIDLDGRLGFMTEAGQKIMEVADFGALCGMSWPTLWTGAGRGDAETAIASAREGGVGRFRGFCPTLKGTPKHWDVVVTPIRSAEGAIVNLLAISRDITSIVTAEAARKAAETKLSFDESLLSAILRAAPVGISVSDAATGEAILLNDTLRTMLGPLGHERGIARYDRYRAVHRDGRRYEKDDYPSMRVLATGEAVPWEDMLYRRDGETDLQLFEATSAPVHDDADKLIASITILRDVGAERSAKAESAQLASLVEQASDVISISLLDGRFDYVNLAGLTLLGFPSIAASRDAKLLSFFSPQSREIFTREALPALQAGHRWEGELVLCAPGRGELPVSHSAVPMRDARGAITCFGAVTRDRAAQQAEEARRRLLSNELSHRMKNMLAMVQSIGFQTLRSAPDLPTARETLSARIVAMSKAHDLLLEDAGQSADIRTIIAAAVAPYDEVGSPVRFRFGGPSLPVGPRAAMALSLMLHELATNAVKYGALSVPSGAVTIGWSISKTSFSLRWHEQGGPRVTPPTRAGFGSRLIERGLAADVGGTVKLTYAPDGVVCEMDAALAGLQAGAARPAHKEGDAN